MKLIIYADGVSRGNPGPPAIGATIRDEHGRLIAGISRRIDWTTNNQAEYQAIIATLEEAVNLGASQVDISMDSELVVRQLKGEYRVKRATLKLLYQRVKELESQLKSFAIRHIPRELNQEADELANVAFDGN